MDFNIKEFQQALVVKIGDNTMKAAGRQSKVSETTLHRIVKNGAEPGMSVFITLCKWLNISPATFFTRKPDVLKEVLFNITSALTETQGEQFVSRINAKINSL